MITEMPEIIFEAVEPLVVVEIPTEFGVEETEGKFFVFSIIKMRPPEKFIFSVTPF